MNMGGEMVYILAQRLQAQQIPSSKGQKVLCDVVRLAKLADGEIGPDWSKSLAISNLLRFFRVCWGHGMQEACKSGIPNSRWNRHSFQ